MTDIAGIIKLDTDIPRWVLENHFFGIERTKVKVTSHKNTAGMGLCTLVSAGFY